MAKSADDFNKKRLRSSNITVVVSIALVLFLIGLIGLILINAQKYSDYIKEQLVVNAFFDEHYDVKDSAKIAKLQAESVQQISKLPFVKKANYISREKAAEEAQIAMGVNSEALFDKNIFPASVEVSLKPEYVDPKLINKAIAQLSQVEGIKEVKNNSTLTYEVYRNLNRILTWILGFSVIFLIVAMVIINNSIRLKIFSKRFIIKTMQLVGAQRRFILLPFIKEAAILGTIGALIGLTFLFVGWYYFTNAIDYTFITDQTQFIWLIVLVIVVGIVITILSTIIATWRFLRTSVDDLYYS